VSTRASRQLTHALHMAAICQMRQPHSAGRPYVDRKVAEGKTKTRSDPSPQATDAQRRLPTTRRGPATPDRLTTTKVARLRAELDSYDTMAIIEAALAEAATPT
jgi:hypothetical protein